MDLRENLHTPRFCRTRTWLTEWEWKVHLERKRNGLLIWKELPYKSRSRNLVTNWLRTIKVKGLINENPAIKKDEIISGRVSDTSNWK